MKVRIFSKLLAAIILTFWLAACHSDKGPVTNPTSFKGKSVSDFLAAYSLNLNDAMLLEEPPGYLFEIRFHNPRKFPGQIVMIDIENSGGLFSPRGEWDKVLVKRAIIDKISLSPQRTNHY